MKYLIFVSLSVLQFTLEAQKSATVTTAPVLFMPEKIATGNYERDITFSPGMDEIYYTIQDQKSGYAQIVFIKKTLKGWTLPQTASFSGKYSDMEASFSPDGNKIYFASNRPLTVEGEVKDYDIWVTERKNGVWQTPTNLGTKVNSPQDEFYPSVGKSGNIYFTATRKNGIGKEDIHMCKFENGTYSESVPLDTMVNSTKYEFNAFVNADETLIVFTSYGRKDDMGGGDLYYCLKSPQGNWSKAIHMNDKINSTKLDYCPYVSYDKRTLYFTSERTTASQLYSKIKSLEEFKSFLTKPGNGNGDIYSVPFTW